MAALARPAIDSAAFDAAFSFGAADDLEMIRSELATMAAMATPTPQHQLPADLRQMSPLPSLLLQRQMSFSELPMIGELTTPSPEHHMVPTELSLDIMQSLYGSPVSPDRDGTDSGNASDSSGTFSGSSGSPPSYAAEAEAEEGGMSPESSMDMMDMMDMDLENDPAPFSKARPFAKKSRATFLAELTADERALLREEGVHIPADGTTLTKAEERLVKKVRRKIKNKMSAQDSRKKKKEYVDGLEARVEQCTKVNVGLRSKIGSLEGDNKTLLQQLKELQAQVQKMASGSNASASTCLMLLGLCFSVYLNPAGGGGMPGATAGAGGSSFAPSSFSSRTLKSLPSSLGDGNGNGHGNGDTLAWFNTFFKEGDAAASEGRPSPYASDATPTAVVEEVSEGEEEAVEDRSVARKRKTSPVAALGYGPADEQLAANVSDRGARLAARVVKRSRPVA